MKAGDAPRIAKDAAGNLHLVILEEIAKTDFDTVRPSLEKEELLRTPTPQEKSDYVNKLREAAAIVS